MNDQLKTILFGLLVMALWGGVPALGSTATGVHASFLLPTHWQGPYLSPDVQATVLVHGVTASSAYAATDKQGVFYSSDGGRTWSPRNTSLETALVLSLAVCSNGWVYAGVWGRGVYRYREGGSDPWQAVNAGLGSSYVNRLLCDAQGRVLAGTDEAGIYILESSANSWRPANNGLLRSVILGLEDIGGRMFAGTDSGIYTSVDSGASWQYAGLAGRQVYAFAQRGSEVWAGANNGVYRSTDGGVSWPDTRVGDLNDIVYTLVTDQWLRVYAGTRNTGVHAFDGGTWAPFGTGLGSNRVYSLLASKQAVDQTLMAGTGNGIWLSAVVATLTPTVTPTSTFTETPFPTSTSTRTPTPTLTHTPTPTFTSTPTSTPPPTSTPGLELELVALPTTFPPGRAHPLKYVISYTIVGGDNPTLQDVTILNRIPDGTELLFDTVLPSNNYSYDGTRRRIAWDWDILEAQSGLVQYAVLPWTPTPTASPSVTPTPTITPTRTPSPSPAPTATSTSTSTPTPSPTATTPPTSTPTATPTSAPTATFTLTATPTATATHTGTPTPDPSYTPTATPDYGIVKGVVFEDIENLGTYDAGERGISPINLKLNRDDEPIHYAVTQPDGAYHFPPVAPGQYVLSVLDPPASWILTTGNNPFELDIAAGDEKIVHFGFRPPATPTPTPTSSSTATPTATPTPTASPTPTSSPTVTSTATPSPTPTATPTPSRTPTVTSTPLPPPLVVVNLGAVASWVVGDKPDSTTSRSVHTVLDGLPLYLPLFIR